MSDIVVKYDEVYSRTAELKKRIGSDLTTRINDEYAQIENLLSSSVDGATTASLLEVVAFSKRKSIAAASALEKIVDFMADSAKEIQRNEAELARSIASGN